jgi:DNA-binding LacI/PurR family transcriptional regulator
MGRLAAEMIVNRLSGHPVLKKIIDVGFKLVIKGSTVKFGS